MKQKIAEILGENGCYFFSILYLAEKISGKKFNPLDIYLDALAKRFIEKDCFINDAGKLLSMLTGQNWQHTKQDVSYIAKKDELEILYFENPTTLKTYGHFVVGNKGKVEYDPYGDSKTVKEGKLHSKRVFSRIDK